LVLAKVVFVVVFVVAVWLWLCGAWVAVVWVVIMMFVGTLFGVLLKEVVFCVWPVLDALVAFVLGYSFPFGYVLNVVLGCSLFVVLFWRFVSWYGLWVLFLLGVVLLVVFIGFDWLVFGVYFLIDVLVGWLVGMLVVVFFWVVFGLIL